MTAIKENGTTPVYTFPEMKQDRVLWLDAVGRTDLVKVLENYAEEEFEMADGKTL